MKTHELRCWPVFFNETISGKKNFEFRNNRDRDFQEGDVLQLKEWDPVKNEYTGRGLMRKVTYVMPEKEGWEVGLPKGFTILGLEKL
jgi:hypothetical protein